MSVLLQNVVQLILPEKFTQSLNFHKNINIENKIRLFTLDPIILNVRKLGFKKTFFYPEQTIFKLRKESENLIKLVHLGCIRPISKYFHKVKTPLEAAERINLNKSGGVCGAPTVI